MVVIRCDFGARLPGERPPGSDAANGPCHTLNGGNRRESVFHETEDFEALERLMVGASERSSIKLLPYYLLPNH